MRKKRKGLFVGVVKNRPDDWMAFASGVEETFDDLVFEFLSIWNADECNEPADFGDVNVYSVVEVQDSDSTYSVILRRKKK